MISQKLQTEQQAELRMTMAYARAAQVILLLLKSTVSPSRKLHVDSGFAHQEALHQLPSARPGGCCIFLLVAAAPRGWQNELKDGILYKNTSYLQEAQRTSHFWDFHSVRANFSCSLNPDRSLLCLPEAKRQRTVTCQLFSPEDVLL